MTEMLRRLTNVQRRVAGRTTIAHLSDFHFVSTTNTQDAVWSALLADFTPATDRPKIDIVAVTGDIIDASVRDLLSAKRMRQAFERAREFLYLLCNTACVPLEALFVVPGNHDVRAKGLFSSEAQATLFTETFGAHYEHALLPDLRTFIFPFDSNTSVSKIELAAGTVRDEAFPRFKMVVGCAKTEQGWENCARVALVHHHPMPIAATEHRTFENLEEYLLLRNAGMFMTEIVRHDFDLILHGHKHYPAMSRATFIDDDGTPRSVAVVAAGSASHGIPCYNIITIFDGGGIELERRSRTVSNYAAAASTDLVSYSEARRRRWDRLEQASDVPLSVQIHEKVTEIRESSGDTWVRESIAGASPRGAAVERLPQRFWSDSAYINTPTFDQASRMKWEWTGADPGGQWRVGATVFSPPIRVDERLSWRRTTRYANAIFFSRQDRLDTTDQNIAFESVSHLVPHICERLVLAVTFPADCLPDSVRLCVMDPKDVRDAAEEAFCARALARIEASRTYVLVIDRPLPRYTYEFRWDLKPEDPSEPRLLGAESNAALAAIEHISHGDDDRAASILAALTALQWGFAAFEALRAYDTMFDVTLFVYDRAKGGLRASHSTTAPTDAIRQRVIKAGREVVGQTWRRRQSVVYVAESGAPAEENELRVGAEDLIGVIGVPLFYPVVKGRRVAVLSLASRSRRTWLTRLDSNPKLVKWVTEEVWLWWRGFLREEVALPPQLGTADA